MPKGVPDALINCALPSGCSGSSARPPLGCWGDSNTAGLCPALTISISALSGCSRKKTCGHVAQLRFGPLLPVLLVQAGGKFIERQQLSGQRAHRRAKAAGDDGRSEALAGDIGHHHQMAAISKAEGVHVIAAYLVAGSRAAGDGE